AVDDLNALADLCAEQDMWLHVDGAYGAPAAGTESGRPLFAGLERVDSLAIDAHKWLYVPFTASAVLVRDPLALERSFSVMADYAESSLGDARSVHFMERGIQMSRSFAALKVWMTLRGYGARRLRDAIEENIQTMRYLGRLLEEADDFELLIPVRLSVVCFRYVPGQLDEGALDELNSAIFQRLESDGIVAIGRVTINGRTALRACSVKFRTEPEHVRHLLSAVRQAGALIVQTRSSAT
ncbi:MAG: pyridoxal-dependent decarboxylase, partial [Acidobacteriota bacterium]